MDTKFEPYPPAFEAAAADSYAPPSIGEDVEWCAVLPAEEDPVFQALNMPSDCKFIRCEAFLLLLPI